MRTITLTIVTTILLMTALAAAPLGDRARRIVLDVPAEVLEAQFGREVPSRLSHEDTVAMQKFRFAADTFKVLVILVDWLDRSHRFSQQSVDSMFFSLSPDPTNMTGSVAEYFQEVSYGQSAISGAVRPWYTGASYSQAFDFEGLLAELDDQIDYSQFDGNNDGVVDAVTFIRSGTGREDTSYPQDIWSYAYIYPMGEGPGPFDGMMVSRWNTCPETWPVRDPADPHVILGDQLNRIRVFCHELTHNYGLWDLYDYDSKLDPVTFTTPNDDNDHPVYDWCVMGYGGYAILSIGSTNPSHLCGWSKKELGWITPVELQGSEYQNLVINNIETTNINSLFKVSSKNFLPGEYFLLEYRNPRSTAKYDHFDSDFSIYFPGYLTFGADTLDRGLLITHCDDDLLGGGFSNNGTPDYDHYMVAVVDAGYNPSRDHTYNTGGHVSDRAQWWYPYESRKGALFSSDIPFQNTFSPTTTPSSDGYFAPSGITVRVDSIVGDKLYAYVKIDADGDGIADSLDNCPTMWNPGQADADNDQVGDICDNCPSVANTSQADSDYDHVGDMCDVCVDPDADGRTTPGFPNTTCPPDNCPNDYNPEQRDIDGDGIGDFCDYDMPQRLTDTIATSCVRLLVENDGIAGRHMARAVTMDYAGQGDCDSVYLYASSPVIAYDSAGAPRARHHMYMTNQFALVPGGKLPVAVIDSGTFEVFRCGTFATNDLGILMDRTWYAPRGSGSTPACHSIIQTLRVYVEDGAPASFTVGEVCDWDIPTTIGGNVGGFNASQRLIYLQGTGYECQDNSHRYGGQALLGIRYNDGCIDTAASPYGAFTASNATYVWPNNGFVPSQLKTLMQTPGFSANTVTMDQFAGMTYLNNLTLSQSDTVTIYTVLSTVRDGSAVDLAANVATAKLWLLDHLGGLCGGCCAGTTGNIDGDAGDVADISDLSSIVDYLFFGGTISGCDDENDVDGSSSVDISDLSVLVDFLFFGGTLPACP